MKLIYTLQYTCAMVRAISRELGLAAPAVSWILIQCEKHQADPVELENIVTEVCRWEISDLKTQYREFVNEGALA